MRWWTWLFALTLTGCASTLERDLDHITTGMDKDQVLRLVGSPKRTFRQAGQDHWTYVYYQNDRELLRQVDFRDGRVVKVGSPTVKQKLERELENAETMEEFERKARAHQSKPSDFKDLN